MGQVIRKAIRNILEAPLDVLIELIGEGRGLRKNTDRDFPQLEVKCGSGVELDRDLAVTVKTGHGCGHRHGQVVVITGPGLVINDKAQVAVNPGNGIEVENDKVKVKIGSGLGFDDEGKVKVIPEAVNVGDGLGIKEGKVVVLPGNNISIVDGKVTLDNEPATELTDTMTLLVNSELTILGRKLIMKKTFQDLGLIRNKAGFLLDIVKLGLRYVEDVVELPSDPGYVAMMSVPNRETTAKSPNFYKK